MLTFQAGFGILHCGSHMYSVVIYANICFGLQSYLHVQGRNADTDESQSLRTFKLFWRLYSYSPGQGIFQPVPAIPHHLPRQIRRALETLQLINTAGVLHL